MKKHLIAQAALALFACTASAQSSLTIFGIVDSAYRATKNGSAGTVRGIVTDGLGTSQLGFRGTEDLGGGLSASFWLETQINSANGAAGATPALGGGFFNRRSTLSLADQSWGEIRLGRDYTPNHIVQCRFDPFGCNGLGNSAIYRSSVATSINQGFGSTATNHNTLIRANNAVQYFLPSDLGGVFGSVMVSDREGQATSQAGMSKGRGGQIGYADKKLYLAAAAFHTKNTLVPGESFKDTIFAANYDFGFLRAGLIHRIYKFQSAKLATTSIALTVPVTELGSLGFTVNRANQSGRNANNAAIDKNDANLLAIGYTQLLSKRTSLYGSIGRLDNKGAARFVLPSGSAGIQDGEQSTGYQFGMRHVF